MLGRVERTTDYVYGAPPADFAAAGLLPGVILQFWVEEPEMFVDMMAKVTFSAAAAARVDFTILINSGAGFVDIAAGTNGLACFTPAVGGDENTVIAQRTVRLPQGRHTARLSLKSATTPTVEGATIPCELMAMRNSHMATLGHGVDSKVQLIQ